MKISLVMCPIWSIDEPPMATACLAGYLKARGHEVSCHDFSVELYNEISGEDQGTLSQLYITSDWNDRFEDWRVRLDLDDRVDRWARRILAGGPDLVGLTIYDATRETSILLAHALKRHAPRVRVIFGGPSCHDNPALILRAPVDLMVYGEGEETFTEVLARLEKGGGWEDCAGVIYRSGDEAVRTEPRPLISDLDALPFPDFDDFDFALYRSRMLPMFTSRGCYNRCSFCSEKSRWIRYRHCSSDRIVDEMERNVERYGIHHFDLVDSLINGNLNEFARMCDLILERGLSVTWGGKARIHPRMDRSFLEKTHAAGCRLMIFGIESASQKVLNDMDKNVAVSDIRRVIVDCHEVGIKVGAFFVLGYVTETEEDFQQTLDFVKEYHPYMDTIFPGNGLVILKGSPLYEQPEKYGLLLPEETPDGKWRSLDGRNTEPVRRERVARFNRLVTELENQALRREIERLQEEGKTMRRAASKLVGVGERVFAAGDHEAALEIFLRIAQILPDDPVNWNNLGVAFLVFGRMENAEECFTKAVSLKGDFRDAWENLRKLKDLQWGPEGKELRRHGNGL